MSLQATRKVSRAFGRFSGWLAFAATVTWSIAGAQCFGQAVTEPSIQDFSWIAGHWRGEALGGQFEETWNPPLGGTMLGMFKLCNDEGVVFHEILTIMKDDGQFVLRLKHFDEKLVGWEKKDAWQQFPFKSISKNEIVFDGLRFERVSPERMSIIVLSEQADQKSEELIFKCKKVGIDANAF